MAHHVYDTEGFILGSTPLGEANHLISVLTQELGFIRGFARSSRRENSKLRYALQNLSFVRLSLVRGKEMWRIIGAHEGEQMYRELCHDEAKLALLGNLRALLMRLVQGEDRHEHLF